jgi:hypothetical protein
MITALPHLRRRVLKRKNARFQCRLYKHSFRWTLGRLAGHILTSLGSRRKQCAVSQVVGRYT